MSVSELDSNNPADDSLEDTLFEAVSFTRWHFPRYRGVFLNADGSGVLVSTQAGGRDRTKFAEFWSAVRRFPGFIGDYDDSSDSTFAWVVFAVPQEKQLVTQPLATGKEPAIPPAREIWP